MPRGRGDRARDDPARGNVMSPGWINPGTAMNLVFDDPAHLGPDPDFGFAVVWSMATDRQTPVYTADVARAKLQPRQPTAAEYEAAGGSWPVTAHDHRLVLAQNAPDPDDLSSLCRTYDRGAGDRQKMLAVMQTCRFSPDTSRHSMFEAVHLYAALCFRPKHLTSLIVQHVPADMQSARQPHVHMMTFIRTHRTSGFGEVHELFRDTPAQMHEQFRNDWLRFRSTLANIVD